MKEPRVAWVVFDLSNGTGGVGDGWDAKNYAKWYKTRSAARKFRKSQLKDPYHKWTPSKVFKYERSS